MLTALFLGTARDIYIYIYRSLRDDGCETGCAGGTNRSTASGLVRRRRRVSGLVSLDMCVGEVVRLVLCVGDVVWQGKEERVV